MNATTIHMHLVALLPPVYGSGTTQDAFEKADPKEETKAKLLKNLCPHPTLRAVVIE